ncbi:type II secretion system protein GspL [Sphingomonas pokkalii]|uniref:General secretion pathway protein GspL n=1 Tax=Sphingomonas pokkalii TaxID=2175090 RepID=A0A2U0SGG3_9SPHN|nr:type II secretion system protein GspL [Sphingomonas pokkalii]PVX30460.1 general secretion pathway protein GspL [Sphingomonas pokkalii]
MTHGVRSPDLPSPHAAGLWTLAGDRLIIVDEDGPATIVVPTERVRLLAVDLPLPNRAKRLAALPFAIEDQVAEPIDSLHLALGAKLNPEDAPARYLVGAVRRETMAGWVALAESQGLGAAPMVPDALLLPRPAEGWSVEIRDGRALVRAADGAGFALPLPLLPAAWEAAGRPLVHRLADPLPDPMPAQAAAADTRPAAARAKAAAAELDLRQGAYAARGGRIGNGWRRLGWIVAIGAAAHVAIAGGDAVLLSIIAKRRASETRELVAIAAPGADLSGDFKGRVTDLLPAGSSAPPDRFVPLLARVSAGLSPLAGSISVQAIRFEGTVMTLDCAAGAPDLAARIAAALRAARIRGQATASPDGTIRITANAA